MYLAYTTITSYLLLFEGIHNKYILKTVELNHMHLQVDFNF